MRGTSAGAIWERLVGQLNWTPSRGRALGCAKERHTKLGAGVEVGDSHRSELDTGMRCIRGGAEVEGPERASPVGPRPSSKSEPRVPMHFAPHLGPLKCDPPTDLLQSLQELTHCASVRLLRRASGGARLEESMQTRPQPRPPHLEDNRAANTPARSGRRRPLRKTLRAFTTRPRAELTSRSIS